MKRSASHQCLPHRQWEVKCDGRQPGSQHHPYVSVNEKNN